MTKEQKALAYAKTKTKNTTYQQYLEEAYVAGYTDCANKFGIIINPSEKFKAVVNDIEENLKGINRFKEEGKVY